MVSTRAVFVLLPAWAAVVSSAAAAAEAPRRPSTATLAHCMTGCWIHHFSYPFGIGPGCFREGFNLTCNTTGQFPFPQLFLGDGNAPTPDIGENSPVTVGVPITFSAAMQPDVDTYHLPWEGPGAPFAISDSSNMSLFVLGCNVEASLSLLGSRADDTAIGSCTVACGGRGVMERLTGLCIGIGCCRIDIRVIVRAFTLKISRRGDAGARVKAFVTGRDAYRFRPSDLVADVVDYTAMNATPAVLDWAIPDQPNCEAAIEEKANYACISSNSECRDSPLGGYVCLCSDGFYGNPYVLGGCLHDPVYNSIQPEPHCATSCGNISVPFPFGTAMGCFARLHLYLACDPAADPPVLLMSQVNLQVTDISIDEGLLYVKKPSDSNDFLTGQNSTSLYAFSGEWGVVEWAIDNLTCQQAKLDKNEYACASAQSECVNVTDGNTRSYVGYRCRCSPGFEGNPYLADGCSDIDECLQPDKYICNGICKNTIGSFTCTSCPHGTEFDPIKRQCKPSNVVLGVATGLGCGAGLLFLILAAIVIFRKWKKGIQKRLRKRYFHKNKGILLEQLISSDKSAADNTKIFSLEELEKATNDFEHTRIVGHGGHGMVYKGILTDQRVVAIKRSKIVEKSEIDQFINEVAILSQINHRNVVKLFGCCLESEVPLLVYEFISNGTLYDLLHPDQAGNSLLPWEERLRIAMEIASALTYLHSAASISIFHRDVKSSNILLNDNHTVKVSDFGASRSIPIDQTHIVTNVQGTFGYLDPEYYYTGQLTEKSDVYSFGVLLVELLTRKRPVFENHLGEKQNLSNYFLRALEERSLAEKIDAQVLEEATVQEIDDVACLAESCLRIRRAERPTMKDVEMRLQFLRTKRATQNQFARGRDEVMQPFLSPGANTHHQAASNDIGSNRDAACQNVSRHYSLEQEYVASMRLPR